MACKTCVKCDVEKARCYPNAEGYNEMYLLDEDNIENDTLDCDFYEECIDNEAAKELILNLKRGIDNIANVIIRLSAIRDKVKGIEDRISVGYKSELDRLLSSLDTYGWATNENKKLIFAELSKLEEVVN